MIKFNILTVHHIKILFEAFYEGQIIGLCKVTQKKNRKNNGLRAKFLFRAFKYALTALNAMK